MNDTETTTGTEPADDSNRRGFFGIASLVIGAIVSLAPFGIGLFAFLDPVTRKKKAPLAHQGKGSGKAGFTKVAVLDSLPEDSPPRRFQVISDMADSWNYLPDQAIGAVYVQRTGPESVRVFNVTCPHAGCSVSCNGEAFHCPCHNSSFNLDGSKRESESGRANPSPRPLDELQVDAETLAETGEIWVEFVNFYTGKETQIPKL